MSEEIPKCFNCDKNAMYVIDKQEIYLCLDCCQKHEALRLQKSADYEKQINYLSDKMRFSILGGEPPRYKIPNPVYNTINQGDIHLNNIKINNSTIGMLNAGSIQNVKNIDVKISSLANHGQADLANSLKTFAEAIANNQEITKQEKTHLLEQTNYLSNQAVLPQEQREIGVIQAVLASVVGIVSTAGGLAETWSLCGDIICIYFGIENPLKK